METQKQAILLEKSYHIPFAMFREAFTAFQKRFVYPRTYCIIALLLLVCAGYCHLLTGDVSSGARATYCMVILTALVLAAFQWYTPRKVRRNLMRAVREIENDQYLLRVYPDYVEIGTILPPEDTETAAQDALFDDVPEDDFSGTRIYFNKGMHVIEYRDFLILYQTKAMFFVIPKDALSEEEQEILRVHLEKKLQKNYKKDRSLTKR